MYYLFREAGESEVKALIVLDSLVLTLRYAPSQD
jgi:hypothetical protein